MKEINPEFWAPPKYVLENMRKKVRAAIVDTGWYYSPYLGSGIIIGRSRKGWWVIGYTAKYHAGRDGVIRKVPMYTYVAFQIRDSDLLLALTKAFALTFGFYDEDTVTRRKYINLPSDIKEKIKEIAYALITGREKELGKVTLYQRSSPYSVNPWYLEIYFTADPEELRKEVDFAL